MFGNNFTSPYGYNSMPTATQPYGYPMNPYTPNTPTQAPAQTNTNMIFVNGLEDVRQRPQANNSVVLYADNDKPLVYKKTVDSKGQYSVEAFDITPHVEKAPEPAPEYATKSEFESLQKKLVTLEETVALLIPTKEVANGTNS